MPAAITILTTYKTSPVTVTPKQNIYINLENIYSTGISIVKWISIANSDPQSKAAIVSDLFSNIFNSEN